MTVDEAVRDLLGVSTDIRRLVVLDEGGAVLGAGPVAAGPGVSAAAEGLWRAAAQVADPDDPTLLEHVVVDLDDAAVAVLEAGGRRIVALTAADPPLGLVLFDLRTCLADAFPEDADAGPASMRAGGSGAPSGAAPGEEPS